MKFNKAQFMKPIGMMNSVASKVNAMPVYSTVLMLAGQKSDEMILLASDAEMQLTIVVPCNDNSGWKNCCLPSRKMNDIIRSIGDDSEVVVSEFNDKKKVSIKAGKSKFSLNVFEHKDFPVMYCDDKKAVKFSVKESVLRSLIKLIVSSVADNDVARYVLNGGLIEVNNGKLTVVGTNGFQLSKSHVEIEDKSISCKAVILKRSLNELLKVLGESDNMVEVSVLENLAMFKIGNVEFITKVIDGNYPPYEKVIPNVEVYNTKVVGEVVSFKNSVGRIKLIGGGGSTNLVEVSSSDDGLVFENYITNGESNDKAIDIVECDIDGGKGIKCVFNNNFLDDILGLVSSEKAKIFLNEGQVAMGVKFHEAEGEVGKNFVGVLMPVRP